MKYRKQYLDPHTPASQVYGMMLHCTKINNPNLHTHNYCEIMLIISGRMKHTINNDSVVLNEKQICFVRDRDIHSCSCHQNAVYFFNIGIPTDLLYTSANYYDIDINTLLLAKVPPVCTLTDENFNALHKKILTFMNTEYNELHGRMFKNILSEFLFLLTAPEISSIHTEYKYNTPKWFLELISEMDKIENFSIGLTKLLELSEHSQEYINRCFKKYLNTTPTQYINSIRLNHAKRLILEEGSSIIDACYDSGFNSEGYFYKVFKKAFNCTPYQMINSHKKML